MDKRLAQKILGNCQADLLNHDEVKEVVLQQADVEDRESCTIVVRTHGDASPTTSTNIEDLVYDAADVFGKTSLNCDLSIVTHDKSRVRHQWVGFGGHSKGVIG